MLGLVRDKFPLLTLSLPGLNGPLALEFIVDTGFEGELALPPSLLRRLEVGLVGDRPILLADGTIVRRSCFEVELEWDAEVRTVEIIELDGNPLLGVELMAESLLQVEMTDGGAVSLESL
jgi:clan AA aspartic protease